MRGLERSGRGAFRLRTALALAVASFGACLATTLTHSPQIGLVNIYFGLLSAAAAVMTFAFSPLSLRWLPSPIAFAVLLAGAGWAASGMRLVEVGNAIGQATGISPNVVTLVMASFLFTAFLIAASTAAILAIVAAARLVLYLRDLRAAGGRWTGTPSARLLWIVARLYLPAGLAPVKVEEWCAELAAIECRWERTVHLIDVLGDMHKVGRAARSGRTLHP